jgi:hypothetical protein
VLAVDCIACLGNVPGHKEDAEFRTLREGKPRDFGTLYFRHDHIDQQDIDAFASAEYGEGGMPSIGNSNLVAEALQAGNGKGAHVGVIVDDENAGSCSSTFSSVWRPTASAVRGKQIRMVVPLPTWLSMST